MSGRSLPIRLTVGAQQDYDDILLHSLSTWGTEQMRRYQGSLHRAMEELRDFPEIGPGRDDLFAGCRIRPVEPHVIYYCTQDEAVVVINILQERADPARHLFR